MTKLRKDRPGYQYYRRADGSYAHYWNPARACKNAPPGLPTRQITAERIIEELPTLSFDTVEEAIPAICQFWTDQLKQDLENASKPRGFDGTISSLIHLYRTNKESPYFQLKHSTRIRDYEPALKLIDKTVGKRRIDALRGSDFRRWYVEWGSKGRVRRAHGAIRKLRLLLSYGVQEKLPGCGQAREILSLMEFDAPPVRKVKMEYEHALAICKKALELGRPSIALTQALQWDTALRRIHIIGEWVPVKDGDEGGIVRGKTQWKGLTAADISPDMILTVPETSKNKKATTHDLKVCDLVQFVLQHTSLPKFGPLIVSEVTGLPYRENYYATEWREIANAAGVPENVWSMDSRAGAISEAELATKSIEAARKMAGHTNVKTTMGYVRNDDLENNRQVAQARARLRSVTGQ